MAGDGFDPSALTGAGPDVSNIGVDPSLAETPVGAPGGATAGGLPVDALGPAAAPVTAPSAFAGPSGDIFASPMDPGSTGFTDTGAAAGAATPADTPGPGPNVQPPAPNAPMNRTGGIVTGDAQSGPGANANQNLNAQGQPQAGGAGGGANAGNPFQSLASALNGVARAAQGGNPQAQQIMNMLRQMQMQAAMGQMGGMGQGYNPYMNQMFNQNMMARMRMEHMRREFMRRQMEQQRLRAQPGTAAAMNPRGGGGGRGRR